MPRKRTAKRKKTNSSKKSKSSTKKLKSKRKRVKKIKTLGRPLSLSLIEVKERPKLSPLVIDVVVDKPCPVCKTPLSDTILCNTEVDFCPHCFGLWFEEEELRWAKDEKDKNLNFGKMKKNLKLLTGFVFAQLAEFLFMRYIMEIQKILSQKKELLLMFVIFVMGFGWIGENLRKL